MIGHGHIDPAMLAEIRKRVAESRWNIVGGWGFPTGKDYSRLARAL